MIKLNEIQNNDSAKCIVNYTYAVIYLYIKLIILC